MIRVKKVSGSSEAMTQAAELIVSGAPLVFVDFKSAAGSCHYFVFSCSQEKWFSALAKNKMWIKAQPSSATSESRVVSFLHYHINNPDSLLANFASVIGEELEWEEVATGVGS